MSISTFFRSQWTLLALLLACFGLSAPAARAQTVPSWTSVQRTVATGSNGAEIAVAADGSKYITGNFNGTLTLGSITLTAASGAAHLFLAKYSANGVVLWANKIDGALNYVSVKLAVDAAGNSFLTGTFANSITLGTTVLFAAGFGDCYLVKYDAQGVQQWVRQGSGSACDANDVATDAMGNVSVVGHFSNSVVFGGTFLIGSGTFYYKFSPTGNILQAKQVSSDSAYPTALTIDGVGNTYIAGNIIGTSTFGSITLISAGSYDVFVCKLDAAGNTVWANRDGGVDQDLAYGVAVDTGGNPVVCGVMNNAIYVARFSSLGSVTWSRLVTSAGQKGAYSVAYDGRGGYLVTGQFRGTALFGTTSLSALGQQVFVARYDMQGNIVWAGQGTGPSVADTAIGFDIFVDAGGNGYIAGTLAGTVTFGTLPAVPASGNNDSFVAKLTPGGVLTANRPAEAKLALHMYPNPAIESVNLELPIGGGQIAFFDMLGRLMQQCSLPAAGGKCIVSLAGLVPGLYQVRTTFGNGQLSTAQLSVR